MSQITVTIGQIPGRPAQELSLDQGSTIADAIARSGLSTNGYEIRVNNVPTRELNTPLSDEDFVSLVQSIKGNASTPQLLEIEAIIIQGKKKKTQKFPLPSGSLLVSVKSTLSLPGKFADYDWTVGSAENCEKSFVLGHDSTITIVKKTSKKAVKAEKKEEKPAKKADISDTMEVFVSINGGPTFVKTLPKRARVSALLKELGYASLKDLKSMVVNGKTVTLGFFEIKAGASVEIEVEEAKTDSAPKPDKAPTKKLTKKVLKKVAKEEKKPAKATKKTEEKANKEDYIESCDPHTSTDETNCKNCEITCRGTSCVKPTASCVDPTATAYKESREFGENFSIQEAEPERVAKCLDNYLDIFKDVTTDGEKVLHGMHFSKCSNVYDGKRYDQISISATLMSDEPNTK